MSTAYKTAIADEHYHREIFQSRLGYHTNVVLVALGAVGAALLKAEREWVFRLLGFALLIIGVFAWATPVMIRRIYEHFIENLDLREKLEVALGLRHPNAVADSASLQGKRPSIAAASAPFTAGYLFYESWIRSGKGRGYFSWMKLVFRGLGTVAALAGVALLVSPSRLGVLPQPPARPDSAAAMSQPTVERSLGVIGPFESGETCVTTNSLDQQVAAIVNQAVASGAPRIIVVGSADRMPIADAGSVAFGNNTGLALARARCVAGWISEALARRAVSSIIDVRVRDAAVRTVSARAVGAAEDRVVEVWLLTR